MSQETQTWLRTMTRIGFTDKRGMAWHGDESDPDSLRNHYPGPVPIEAAEELLDWVPDVGDSQTVVVREDGVHVINDPTRIQLVHPQTDAVLGVFKKGYQFHGYNEWLLKNTQAIADNADLPLASVGLLRGGALGWAQFEVEENMVVSDFQYRPFLLAATSLDGSLRSTYRLCVTAVVCDNTLAYGLREGGPVAAIKHSAKSLERIGEVRDALGLVVGTGDAFAKVAGELLAEPVSQLRFEKWADLYSELTKAKDEDRKRAITNAEWRRDQLINLWTKDERVSPWAGTAFGVLQTANTFEHHIRFVHDDRMEKNKEHAVLGHVGARDNKAMQMLAAV